MSFGLRNIVSVAFVVLLLCFAPNSYAAKPLQIICSQQLTFGKAVRPASSPNAKVRVNRNGILVTIGSSPIMLDANVTRGECLIKGSGGGNSIQISIEDGSFTDGVKVKRFRARYDDNTNFKGDTPVSLSAPGNGTTLWYGADLVIKPTASTGYLTPSYTISVEYE